MLSQEPIKQKKEPPTPVLPVFSTLEIGVVKRRGLYKEVLEKSEGEGFRKAGAPERRLSKVRSS